jgi:hypothetical protein
MNSWSVTVAQPLMAMAAVGTAEPYAIKATEPMAMRAPAIMRQSDRAVKMQFSEF